MSLRNLIVALFMPLALCAILATASAAAQSQEETAANGSGESQVESVREPQTIADPQIPVEDLKLMVKPLTRSELEVEADAWFELLRAKARQIANVRLGVRKSRDAIDSNDEQQAKAALEELNRVRESSGDIEGAPEQTAEEVASDDQDDPGNPPNNDADQDKQTGEPAPVSKGPSRSFATSELKEELLEDINQLLDERAAVAERLEVVLNSLEAKGGQVETYRLYAAAVTRVELETSDFEVIWTNFIGWMTSKEGGLRWIWNLIGFLTVLLIAYLVARTIAWIVNWLLERKVKLSQLAESLIANTIRNVVLVVGLAIALTKLEIDITPILAAIGAMGLVVGLALQNSLSNIASGLMVLINRPFDVGDTVTAGGVTGKVNKMNLFSTTFRTFDNQTIHVPNNEVWNNVITNITANPTRRVDLEFGIGYDDDLDLAEQIITQVVQEHDLVLADPEPDVVTHALADSSVNIVCRPWAKTSDWWKVKTDVTREVKRRFDAAGISIPFPQRDVHVYQATVPGPTANDDSETSGS